MSGYESHVERLIREATERGEFDNLPDAGKPLDLSGADDPNWWVKRKLVQDDLDPLAALPVVLQLRKERDGYPQSLADIRDERTVRHVLADFNRRVRLDRLEPRFGPTTHLVVQTVDIDDMVRRWRHLPLR
ncbi:MAG TPA: DnaJ family domain-containing protein [Aldersonia sp.]